MRDRPTLVTPSNDTLQSVVLLIERLPAWIMAHAQLRDASLRGHLQLIEQHGLTGKEATVASISLLDEQLRLVLELFQQMLLCQAVAACRERLVHKFRRSGNNDNDADNLAQRTITKAVNKIKRGTKVKNLRAWLNKLASQALTDHDGEENGRKRKVNGEWQCTRPQRVGGEFEMEGVAAQHNDIEEKDAELDMKEAIGELATERQALVYALRLEGTKTDKIAKILNVSERTVNRVLEEMEQSISDFLGISSRNPR